MTDLPPLPPPPDEPPDELPGTPAGQLMQAREPDPFIGGDGGPSDYYQQPPDADPAAAMVARFRRVESMLLGSILNSGEVDTALNAGVTEEMFQGEAALEMWQIAVDMSQRGIAIDTPRMYEEAVKRGTTRYVEPAALADLTDGALNQWRDYSFWAQELVELHTRIRLMRKFRTGMIASLDPETPIDELLSIDAEVADVFQPWHIYRGMEVFDVPPQQWLIEGMVPRGMTWLIGPPSSGKSWLASSLCAALCSGTPFRKRNVRQSPVLYLAAEGVAGLAERVRAEINHRGTDLSDFYLTAPAMSLRRESDVAKLGNVIRHNNIDVVVLDTWARLTAGGDENSAGETGAAIEALDRLRARFDVSFLILHHTGATGERARGSTAIDGAADSILQTAKAEGELFAVTNPKQKDSRALDKMFFKLQPTTYGAPVVQWTQHGNARPPLDLRRDELIKEARQQSELMLADACVRFGDDAVADLVAAGRLVKLAGMMTDDPTVLRYVPTDRDGRTPQIDEADPSVPF